MPATKTRSKAKAKSNTKPKAKAKTTTKAKTSVGMSMPQVKEKAKDLGLMPGKMSKFDLIHAIQEAEQYTPCYGTSGGQCGNSGCCFITDCVRIR